MSGGKRNAKAADSALPAVCDGSSGARGGTEPLPNHVWAARESLAHGWQVEEVCRNCVWYDGRVRLQGEHGGVTGLRKESNGVRKVELGLIGNSKDSIFCCIHVVTDLDFGNTAYGMLPSCLHGVRPSQLSVLEISGQKLCWEKDGPLCSSPYTVPRHTLLKHHRDRGHLSPWHHGETSAQLLLQRAGFGCPPNREEPSLLPSDIHKAHLPAPWARPAALHAAFPSCRAGSSAGLQDRSF